MTMSINDFPNSQVLSRRQKVKSYGDVAASSGRVFQTRRPATVNARSPTVKCLADDTSKQLECNVRRLHRLVTGMSGPMHCSKLPCNALYVSTATLQSICSGTCSPATPPHPAPTTDDAPTGQKTNQHGACGLDDRHVIVCMISMCFLCSSSH